MSSAKFQPHAFTYDVRQSAPSTGSAVKKKFLYGDRTASSRVRRSKNTAQEVVWTTYPAGVYQKREVELNSVAEALVRTRSGGSAVPPKVTQKRPPTVPTSTFNVPWTPISTDVLGFPFHGVITEMEGSDTGQYQGMILYTYYNQILPQYSGSLYVSTDYGYSWTQTVQANTIGYGNAGLSYYSVSRNGQYHIFVTTDSQVMISGDYGSTWVAHAIDPAIAMPTVCISNDGRTVIVGHHISFDGGQTFTPTNIFTDVGGFAGTFCAAMSTNAQYMAVAMETDIWVSNNGGQSFTPTLSVLQPETGDGSFTGSVNMTPDGQHLYVSKQDVATNTTILYVSNDYGVTWSPVVPRDALTGAPLPPSYWTKRSISVDGQSQVVSMIVFDTTVITHVVTYSSFDAGVTWTLLDKAMPPAENWAYTPLLTDKGVLSYANTNQDPYQASVYVYPEPTSGGGGTAGTGIDTQPWRALTTDVNGQPFQGTYVVELAASATGQYVTILVDYFVYTSHDFGRTWRQTQSNVKAVGYMSDMFSYMAVSRSGQHQVILDLDQQRLYMSADYGITWNIRTLPPSVRPSVCISDDGQTLYFGNVKSTDGGVNFTALNLVGVPVGVDPSTIVTTANAMSADGNIVTLTDHTAGRIYVSRDSGASFRVIATYIDGTGTVVAIPGRFTGSVCMSYNGEYQYTTCFHPSIFFQSSDYGATWHSVDARDENGAPMAMNYYWTKRSMDPSTQNQIICNTNAFHAYFSVDGGIHWKQLVQAYDTRGEVNSLTPIMTTQTVLNTWKNEIYIYP
jgi:hypothetical protein